MYWLAMYRKRSHEEHCFIHDLVKYILVLQTALHRTDCIDNIACVLFYSPATVG